MTDAPTFPPLLTGRQTAPGTGSFTEATRAAASERAGAGDVFWSPDETAMDVTVILEPECERARAMQMLFTVMVAFGDSFGAIAPPEIGLFYRWPNQFSMSGAHVGGVRIAAGPEDSARVPSWLAVGLSIRKAPYDMSVEPGHDLQRTTLWDEGGGELPNTQMISSYARHLLTWIHTWSEDGFRPVHDAWMSRALGRDEIIRIKWQGAVHKGKFLGIDEEGRMLLKTRADTIALPLDPILERS